MAFRGSHWAVVNGNVLQTRANAPGQRGIFCVKYFVLCTYLAKKLHAKNQRLEKFLHMAIIDPGPPLVVNFAG